MPNQSCQFLIKLSYYEITAHPEEERKSEYLILTALGEKTEMKQKWREGGGENEGGRRGRQMSAYDYDTNFELLLFLQPGIF